MAFELVMGGNENWPSGQVYSEDFSAEI
jgi:hypothetical protein